MGMDVFGIADPTCYFRASVWSWRPIYLLICEANARFRLGITEDVLNRMSINAGEGLRTQTACDALADALTTILSETANEFFTFDSDAQGIEGAIESALMAMGWRVEPCPYQVHRTHIEEFIRFLRTCGGFEIW